MSSTRSRRGEGLRIFLCQFREITEVSDVGIIGGYLSTSSFSERGKAKLSSIKEAWEQTLLILSYLVPMWDQIEDAGDCCGLIVTTRNFTNRLVVRHGSLQLGRTYPSSCSAKFTRRNGLHAMKLPKNTEGSVEKRGAEKRRRRDKHVRLEIPKRAMVAAMLAPLAGHGRSLLDPPWLSSFSAHLPLGLPRFFLCLESVRSARCPDR